MAGKSSSLLTKTQRRRIRNEFEDLSKEKKHRDQQRIRSRISSGMLDFQLLREYPDRQLEMAFDDLESEELRAALADAYLVHERIRALNGIDRSEVIETARERAPDSSETRKVASLDEVVLKTNAEVEAEAQAELETQFQRPPWESRASTLLKLGAGSFILLLLIAFLDEYFVSNLVTSLSAFVLFLAFFGVVCLVGWFLITVIYTITEEVVPSVQEML